MLVFRNNSAPAITLGVPWYIRNRSYDTMLPLFNRRNMKKFAILICVNRKICDNLELEKIVVLRKRIIPFIFSSLRNPFDPSQPSPICPVSFGIRNSWKITFPLYPRKYQMNNFNQLLRSEISKLVILLKDQLLPIGDIRSFFLNEVIKKATNFRFTLHHLGLLPISNQTPPFHEKPQTVLKHTYFQSYQPRDWEMDSTVVVFCQVT